MRGAVTTPGVPSDGSACSDGFPLRHLQRGGPRRRRRELRRRCPPRRHLRGAPAPAQRAFPPRDRSPTARSRGQRPAHSDLSEFPTVLPADHPDLAAALDIHRRVVAIVCARLGNLQLCGAAELAAGLPRRRACRVPSETNVAPLRRAGRRGRGRFRAMGLARPWLDRHGRRTARLRLAGTRGGAGCPLHGESAIVEVSYGVFLRVPEARSANMRPPVADYDATQCMMGDPHLSRQFSLADAPGGVPGVDFAHKLIN